MVQLRHYQGDPQLRRQLLQFLTRIDQDFVPPLLARVSAERWVGLFERGTILCATHDDRLAGCAVYYPALTAGGVQQDLLACVNVGPVISAPSAGSSFAGGYLHLIATAPESRRQGTGSHLMTALLRDAASRAVDRLRVITWSTNAASLALYRRHGFHVFHTTTDERGAGIDSVYLEAEVPSNSSTTGIGGACRFDILPHAEGCREECR